MENNFDQYEFENYLTDEFFNGNDKSEAESLIRKRLITDTIFKEQYEQWIEESSYKSWKDYYQFLQDEEDIDWVNMHPNDAED
jgi:hypothetical protein